MKKMQKTFAILCCFLVPYFFQACSRTEPSIVFGFINLVYYQDATGPQERFTFFILADDDDGIENLDELFLYHDREQLRWHLRNDDWVEFVQEGRTWIGSRSITVNEGERLPRGQFRAVLVNMSGERAERNFTFDAPEEPRFPFPSLQVNDGYLTVNSLYPVNNLICYDAGGNVLFVMTLENLSGYIETMGFPAQTWSVALWAEDPQFSTSAFTDAVSIR